MSKENLELRMMGLVPYNISPIQQAIMIGHAVVEYGQKFNKQYEYFDQDSETYNDWANNWKTFIILNGGTTNNMFDLGNEGLPIGTLNQHVLTLSENDIKIATFDEPDLGAQLTAVVFIVDERVFDRKNYPNYEDWLEENDKNVVKETELLSSIIADTETYDEWVEFVGGYKNVFLREFLRKFRLA